MIKANLLLAIIPIAILKKVQKKVTQIIHLVILQDQSQIQKILFLEVDQTHILHLLILVHIVMKNGKKVKIPKFL